MFSFFSYNYLTLKFDFVNKNANKIIGFSKYNADSYYDHVKIALGDEFESIFPELIALLPDINKQKVKIAETKNHSLH